MTTELTNWVLCYQKSGEGFEKIFNEIALRIYKYPCNKLGFIEDDSADFFLFIYPTILRMINRFQYIGPPFEAYLAKSLKCQFKTYMKQKIRKQLNIRIEKREIYRIQNESLFTCEPEETLSIFQDNREQEKAHEIFRVNKEGRCENARYIYRILICAMKSVMDLQPYHIDHLAYLTGYSKHWLEQCCEKLKKRITIRKERIAMLTQKRNRTYLRLQMLEEEKEYTENRERREELSIEIGKMRRRYWKTQTELSGLYCTPTHRDIADVLDCPKGTVDSSVYNLRKMVFVKRGIFS